MCGISGIISIFNLNKNSESDRAYNLLRVKKMTEAIAHRGPDDEAYWNNVYGTAMLGHRRLSIIDLSPAGAQPMHYAGRCSIVYNGEIYNYIELRKELAVKGYSFHTASDTEVILAAYDLYKEKCVSHFDGMFAFSIWDEKEQSLFAARDRFGEKPFYYHEEKDCFLFASEMKAFWAAGIDKTIEEKMLLNYLSLGYVQNPTDKEQTFFKNIYSLPPAHYLKCDKSLKVSIHRWWSLNKESKISISSSEAADKFYELFSTAVKRRLRSDVSIGTSLSGGLDSSSIIATIMNNSELKPQTFSAVFPGFEKDESKYIQLITQQFDLKNHQVEPTADGLIKDIEKLCYHQEEPFSSSSIFAQYKVFDLAKQQGIKVLLDGQGADEILAGYSKYIHWYLQEVLSRHRIGAAQKERKALKKNGIAFHWGIDNIFAAFMPAHAAIQLEKNEYRKTVSQPDVSKEFLRSCRGKAWEGIHKPIVTKLNDILHFNVVEFGLEELLRYADRNSMAHGREVRLPFLEPELVKFVFSLPSTYKIHEGWTKWLLRKTMDQQLPSQIVWRTDKIGYEPPQQQWMQDPLLQDYMHEAKKKLINYGILNTAVLNKKVKPAAAHDKDNFDWRYLSAAQIL